MVLGCLAFHLSHLKQFRLDGATLVAEAVKRELFSEDIGLRSKLMGQYLILSKKVQYVEV